MNIDNANTQVVARVRMRRYRSKHRRIDYVPSPEVLAVIKRHQDAGLNNCMAGVIDDLVMAGSNAITGNSSK